MNVEINIPVFVLAADGYPVDPRGGVHVPEGVRQDVPREAVR